MVAFLRVAVLVHVGLLASFVATCLANSSGLRHPYDPSTSNDPQLAALGRLSSLARRGFNHLQPTQEQSLRFMNANEGVEPSPSE